MEFTDDVYGIMFLVPGIPECFKRTHKAPDTVVVTAKPIIKQF